MKDADETTNTSPPHPRPGEPLVKFSFAIVNDATPPAPGGTPPFSRQGSMVERHPTRARGNH